MTNRIKVGISRCLMGQKVRFDGGHKKYHYATELLSEFFDIEAVCPEVESGHPIPRPTIHLRGDPEFPSIVEVMNP